MDDDDINNDDEIDDHIHQFIRRRTIPRRTNWRYRYMALSQREISQANALQLSISDHVDFLLLMILLTNQLLTVLHLFRRQIAGQNNSRVQRMTTVIRYYTRLIAFCYLRLDHIYVEEAELVGIRRDQWEAMVAREVDTPPRNRSLDEISDGDAFRLTRFRKPQLQLLIQHWRIPDRIVTNNRYSFTGEEILVVCLSKIATGLSWTQLCKDTFGGEPRRWSLGFKWFINHLFVTFYHKISGRSIELWLGDMDNFKHAILDRLAQPAYPFEVEYFEDIGHPERAQYVVNCDPDHWRVFGFLDDTNVRSSRPGSGPVGAGEGSGRPRRNMAYDVQRAFYR
jgi:hypothetical protein